MKSPEYQAIVNEAKRSIEALKEYMTKKVKQLS